MIRVNRKSNPSEELSVMTNRDRAWRRRQRFLLKVTETREWVNEQLQKSAKAVRSAAKQPAKITLKAQHHLAKRAQVMREGWRSSEDLREALD